MGIIGIMHISYHFMVDLPRWKEDVKAGERIISEGDMQACSILHFFVAACEPQKVSIMKILEV
jgi:hypothetical protein